MASRLFGLGRAAGEYVRQRMNRQTVSADKAVEALTDNRTKLSLARRLARVIFGITDKGDPRTTRPKPPTGTPTAPTLVEPPGQRGAGGGRPVEGQPGGGDDGGGDDGYGPELGYGDFQFTGRDATYDRQDWEAVMEGMRVTPGSSNVYGYYFEREARRTGILYVTFKQQIQGTGARGDGPGSTYAYYDVPVRKYQDFKRRSAESAGKAVWDYLRVRGTIWAHQHNYRLVQVTGDYVPRKATRKGYRERHLPVHGTGRREYRRSTLPENLFLDRGEPDRGAPDTGD